MSSDSPSIEDLEQMDAEIEQQDQPENTFDEATAELMQLIKEKTPPDCEAVIIFKPANSEQPIVFTQGHPYEVTALSAQFTRMMKSQLLQELEA